jgi:hypothetical protein
MAAWNERRLVRDVYDIWFYLRMGVHPDKNTLEKRLAKPVYSRLVHKNEYFTGKTTDEFFLFLREQIQSLSDKVITATLSDYLSADELVGLAMRFRAELAKL